MSGLVSPMGTGTIPALREPGGPADDAVAMPRSGGSADDAITMLRPGRPLDDAVTMLRSGGSAGDAITLRRPPADPVAAAALGTLNEDARVTVPRPIAAPPTEGPTEGPAVAAQEPDAGATEPSIPVLAVGDDCRVDVPLHPTPPPPPAPPGDAQSSWGAGLAARIDAALDSDSWSKETPVVPPTSGEIRLLLGKPETTREQPTVEIEQLQRRAAELAAGDAPRRAPHPTAEVDPDDIEAAIEVAPPARRATHPNAIGARPRKPDRRTDGRPDEKPDGKPERKPE
jgi:hypothetical protein